MVHLRDVARIELGGENYNMVTKINGQPATGLGIKLATGANALDLPQASKQSWLSYNLSSRKVCKWFTPMTLHHL